MFKKLASMENWFADDGPVNPLAQSKTGHGYLACLPLWAGTMCNTMSHVLSREP